MHPQLELLLEMQDLRSQMRALQSEGVREVESEVFEMEVEDAARRLGEKIDELKDRLDADVRARYDRLEGVDRRMVPVVEGVCYGCFMAVPTARAADVDRNERLETCDHCGRFLYHVE